MAEYYTYIKGTPTKKEIRAAGTGRDGAYILFADTTGRQYAFERSAVCAIRPGASDVLSAILMLPGARSPNNLVEEDLGAKSTPDEGTRLELTACAHKAPPVRLTAVVVEAYRHGMRTTAHLMLRVTVLPL